MLVGSRDLPLEPSKSFGKKYRVEQTYKCVHGEHNVIVEDGWMCYGALLNCVCCERSHCYTDPFTEKERVSSEELCSYCYGGQKNDR